MTLQQTPQHLNFNSHTPHGVRPIGCPSSPIGNSISTHTPHTGCDPLPLRAKNLLLLFQLTHPTRGATTVSPPFLLGVGISTHTPHTGCDAGVILRVIIKGFYFNSHTPHGVRRLRASSERGTPQFQLTHPTRGATRQRKRQRTPNTFQLTHPTRGATRYHLYV